MLAKYFCPKELCSLPRFCLMLEYNSHSKSDIIIMCTVQSYFSQIKTWKFQSTKYAKSWSRPHNKPKVDDMRKRQVLKYLHRSQTCSAKWDMWKGKQSLALEILWLNFTLKIIAYNSWHHVQNQSLFL